MLELALAGEHQVEDIAALLGKSEGAIREALSTAMTKYKRALGRAEED